MAIRENTVHSLALIIHKLIVTNILQIQVKNVFKDVVICGVQSQALIDTGSQVNLVRKNFFDKVMDEKELQDCALRLFGFGRSKVETDRYFEKNIEIDGQTFFTKFHVVPDEASNIDIIIGLELLNKAELIVNNNGIQINKVEEESSIMNFKISDDTVDIGGEVDNNKEIYTEIKDMIVI